MNGTGGRTYLADVPQGVTNYNVQVGLRVPLFAGFSRIWNERAAQAQAEAAAADAESVEQQVVFEVFQAYYALQTATRSVSAADDLLASADETVRVTLGRYRGGVGTILDLLAAQSALADARARRIESLWLWHSALAQLAHDAGILDAAGGSAIRLAPPAPPAEVPS